MILEGLSTRVYKRLEIPERDEERSLAFMLAGRTSLDVLFPCFRGLKAARWRCPWRGVLWQVVGGTSGKLFRVSVEMVGKGSVSQPFFKFPLIITP